tara:strand:- start:831 stop:1424 length:594 start_codon:yes stop_codon:yes gene_type:complete
MKNIKSLFMLSMLLLLSVNISAQSRDSKTIIDPQNPGDAIPLSPQEFEESVLFIQDLSEFIGKSALKKPLTIELINFNSKRKLLPAYKINGVEYSDNGKFNDKVAGDGIFTSVNSHSVKGSTKALSERGAKSTKFKYTQQLSSFRSGKFGPSKLGIGFSCKVRLVTCPESSWYNSCWPLSSPCTCVEFYDCEVSINF